MNIKLLRTVLFCGMIAIILACLLRFIPFGKEKNVSILVDSTLEDIINISELTTAEFKYKGIADVYDDESKSKIRCRACYSAVVKAGIDISQIEFDVDTVQKTVTACLPQIEIKVTAIDEQCMQFLPSDTDVEIESVLKYTREDAENEATKSEEITKTAQENLKSTLEGLLYPFMKSQGYSLMWK